MNFGTVFAHSASLSTVPQLSGYGKWCWFPPNFNYYFFEIIFF